LMPASSARWMASMDFWSSWGPQAYCQSPPPMAQAPKPMVVMFRSELPSCRVAPRTGMRFSVTAEELMSSWMRAGWGRLQWIGSNEETANKIETNLAVSIRF